jgi:hypothetical protein
MALSSLFGLHTGAAVEFSEVTLIPAQEDFIEK